jgi:hypothetical protein
MKISHAAVIVACLLAMAGPAQAQSKAGATAAQDTMQILREKLKADKKLLVAANMNLTEPEAKGFWPLYDEYQNGLNQINDRLAMVIVTFANAQSGGTLTDEKAMSLANVYVSIEEDELKLKRTIAPKLAAVLPGRKAARYLQLETKVRALVKYEIAGEVPLVR